MSVDWTVPQPSYEELYAQYHAAIDVLQTERNAAHAEAKLWKDRYFTTLQELRDCQASYSACDKSHAEWQAAHAEVLQLLRRTEVKLSNVIFSREGADDMLRHYRFIVGMVARGEWPINEIDPELYQP